MLSRFALVFGLSMGLIACGTDMDYPEGGYTYPVMTEDIDTLYSPSAYKNIYHTRLWEKAFNEPNLMLRPMDTDVFRLKVFTSWGYDYIITLSPNKMVVKMSISGSFYPEYDSSRLTKVERQHYYLLKYRSQFLSNKKDSLYKIHPQLFDSSYCYYLLDKSATFSEPFKYSTETIRLSSRKYSKIISLINKSGYWKMPPSTQCKVTVVDGGASILEANTKHQYNYVASGSCTEEKSAFEKACSEITRLAEMEKRFERTCGIKIDRENL